jgi:hypothetical protein
VCVFAVVSVETGKVVESFVRREDAERFLEEVRGDDLELAELLRLESDRARRLTAPRDGENAAFACGEAQRSSTNRPIDQAPLRPP